MLQHPKRSIIHGIAWFVCEKADVVMADMVGEIEGANVTSGEHDPESLTGVSGLLDLAYAATPVTTILIQSDKSC